MIKPSVGIEVTAPQASSSLANALFPKVRQRVLAVLFGNPSRSFYANEVIALAGSGSGAVQRELAGLSQAGLLTVSRQGNQKHYQANAGSSVFSELRGLVLKTTGVVDVLRTALQPLAPQIQAAFVFGSLASQQDTAQSDVDVLVVSASLSYGELFGALEPATAALGRAVNPTLYTPEDLAQRRAQDNAFVTRVLNKSKLWLISHDETLNG